MENPLDNPHLEIANEETSSFLVVMGLGLGIEQVQGHFIRAALQRSPEKYVFVFNYDLKYSTWLRDEGLEHYAYASTALRRPGVYVVEPGKTFLQHLLSGKITSAQVAALAVTGVDRVSHWEDVMAIEHFRRFLPVRSTQSVQAGFFTGKPFALQDAPSLLHSWRIPRISVWPRYSPTFETYCSGLFPQVVDAPASKATVTLHGLLMAVYVEGLEFFKRSHPHVAIGFPDILLFSARHIRSKTFNATAKRLSPFGLTLLESLSNVVSLMKMLEHYDAVSFFELLRSFVVVEQQSEWSLWHHTSVSVDRIYEVPFT